MNKIFLIISLLILSLSSVNVNAQEREENKKAVVYQINIQTEINTTSRIYLTNGLKEANEQNVDAILLNLNT